MYLRDEDGSLIEREHFPRRRYFETKLDKDTKNIKFSDHMGYLDKLKNGDAEIEVYYRQMRDNSWIATHGDSGLLCCHENTLTKVYCKTHEHIESIVKAVSTKYTQNITKQLVEYKQKEKEIGKK